MHIEQLRKIIKEALENHDEALFTISEASDHGSLKIKVNGADFNQYFNLNISLDVSPRA